uniref:Galanin domain-containing protein n=1 Tax=Monopterus albus TaxID=43700 RepID=A0A3Q3J3P6_MONAL
MQRCFGMFCVSLILCAALSETVGLVIAAKEKRGWTLNSAGYLLGPHGIDGHRTLGDKPGLAGKRDMGQEEEFRTGLCVSQKQGVPLSTASSLFTRSHKADLHCFWLTVLCNLHYCNIKSSRFSFVSRHVGTWRYTLLKKIKGTQK